MKHLLEEFKRAALTWNFTHRIIGQESIDVLLDQSRQAFEYQLSVGSLPPCLVDIGAGAGIMGFVWLSLSLDHKCVFIEPKKKSLSFLYSFASSLGEGFEPRIRVIGSKFEDVSRETVAQFAETDFFCASRAFSGAASLQSVLTKSQFSSDPCYVFSVDIAQSKKAQYVLKKIN